MDDEVLERIQGASQIVALLVENGELLSDKRPVELFFYGEKERIDALVSSEILVGYDLRKVDDPSGVTAAIVTVVDDEWVVTTAHDMVMAAREFGVEYDGWEAGLVRQGQ